jgi:N-acetylornithine carbamoyltransferase
MPVNLKGRDLLSTADLSRDEITAILDLAGGYKSGRVLDRPLEGKSIALVFFDPSLRTRASMEIGIHQLGGQAVTLDIGKGTWSIEYREGVVMDGNKTEHIKEAARVLSRYVSAIAVRAFPEMKDYAEDAADPVINAFAKQSDVPVFNLESSRHHPFQGLADLMTIREKLGSLDGQRVTLTWAYHPKPLPMAVPNSFALIAAQAGLDLTIACPPKYDLGDDALAEITTAAAAGGGRVRISRDIREGCEHARIVYPKSWGSKEYYGRPDEDAGWRRQYREWRVDEELMNTTDDGYFMHCLPTRRNVEVTDGVLDGPRNAAIDEAENRLHVQKAVMALVAG